MLRARSTLLPALGALSWLACAPQPELPSGRCCADTRVDGGSDVRSAVSLFADASSADRTSVSTSSPPRRVLRLDGCARDVSPTHVVTHDLSELARLCAQGLRQVTQTSALVDVGAPQELTFPVLANRCVRALAASDGPALSMTLSDDAGRALASGGFGEPLGVMPPQGPVCVRAAGLLRVAITVAARANVLVAVYQSSAP